MKVGSLDTQLELFANTMEETFFKGNVKIEKPKRWLDAMKMLTAHLKEIPKNKKIVLFFDELPWLATRKSGYYRLSTIIGILNGQGIQ